MRTSSTSTMILGLYLLRRNLAVTLRTRFHASSAMIPVSTKASRMNFAANRMLSRSRGLNCLRPGLIPSIQTMVTATLPPMGFRPAVRIARETASWFARFIFAPACMPDRFAFVYSLSPSRLPSISNDCLMPRSHPRARRARSRPAIFRRGSGSPPFLGATI